MRPMTLGSTRPLKHSRDECFTHAHGLLEHIHHYWHLPRALRACSLCSPHSFSGSITCACSFIANVACEVATSSSPVCSCWYALQNWRHPSSPSRRCSFSESRLTALMICDADKMRWGGRKKIECADGERIRRHWQARRFTTTRGRETIATLRESHSPLCIADPLCTRCKRTACAYASSACARYLASEHRRFV